MANSCPLCFKICVAGDKTLVPIKQLVSERQAERLGSSRDPKVHNYCWNDKTITAEKVVDRAINWIPLNQSWRTSPHTGRIGR